MLSKPLQRIAFVRFTPKGKSYAMKCDREDLIVGDEVGVVMYAGTNKECHQSGEITSISYEHWNCSCVVLCHTCEIQISLEDDDIVFIIDRSDKSQAEIQKWRSDRKERNNINYDSDMKDVYTSIAPEIGDDVYLSDGMWLTPDGNIEDRGR